jgi:hypothetical protein
LASEVGSGQVAIFPVFKGFRSAVNKETEGAAKSASGLFGRVFGKTGSDAGKTAGKSFKGAFDSAATGVGGGTLKKLQADAASAARAVSASRLKEQDAAGKLRVAEAQLTETRAKYTAGSSQLIRAEERLATAQRAVATAEDSTKSATTSLTTAQQRLKAATENAGDGADRTKRRFSSFGSSGLQIFGTLSSKAGGFAKIVGAGLGFGLGALAVQGFTAVVSRSVGVITSSITAASNLQQSVGGVQAVFKGSAKTINAWATGAAKSVGLSKNAYNQFAAVIGSQLKGAGVPMDALAKKTDQLIRLGSDLSATYGGTTSEAVEALGAALRGEFDPIEKFGVSLNQAAINAKGVSLGFDLVSGSLSTQGKQAATLALIYDRTRDAQGQFGKQTTTLAEQQQILAAKTENLKAKFGTALLPVASALVGVLSNAATVVLPKLQPLFDGISSRAGALATSLNGIDFGGFIDKVSSFFTTVGAAAGPALSSGFAQLAPIFASSLQQLAPVLALVIPQLAQAATQILPSLLQILVAIAPILPPLAQFVAALAPVLVILAPALAAVASGTAAIVSAVAPLAADQSGIFRFFDTFTGGATVAQVVAEALAGKLGHTAQVVTAFGFVVGVMARDTVNSFQGMLSGVGGVVSGVIGFFGRMQAGITGSVAVAGARVAGFVGSAIGSFGRLVGGIGSAVSRGIAAFNRLPGGVASAVGRAVAFVASLPGRAAGALGNLGGRLFSSGAALIDGFIGGIRSRIAAVANVASAAMAAAARFFPHSPALEGPFSGRGWTYYSGQATLEGYSQGMDSRVTRVRASSAAAMQAASFVASTGRTAAGAGTATTESRPIVMDGRSIGYFQQLANGEATIVLDTQNASLNTAARMGPRRRRS